MLKLPSHQSNSPQEKARSGAGIYSHNGAQVFIEIMPPPNINAISILGLCAPRKRQPMTTIWAKKNRHSGGFSGQCPSLNLRQ
ncbi:hypothetical protein [Hydrogenophaga defluvii]|uniref:Uncharacterized protein n=1 Tax=Hydrogenophaga defluvii TaxID=249410 RepID=A0ABW2SFW5_9BURK